MCEACGCNTSDDHVIIRKPGEKDFENNIDEFNHNHHNHENHHHHHHDQNHLKQNKSDLNHSQSKEIIIERNILHENDLIAQWNRGFFEAKKIFTLNIVSSPGSGKTCLLERTINDLKNNIKFYVVEGDQKTMIDADRINNTSVPVVQINTGQGCHLDADMIRKASKKLDISENSVLIIENVGNLVCPSLFDLGESKRIVIISVTEGEDKPAKYSNIFFTADLCIINKIDLLPYVDFKIEKAKEYALRVNHHLEFIELSAKTGDGMIKWYDWLRKNIENGEIHK